MAKERERSIEADLKNVQDQAEEQCKKLYYAEIELATAKQQVVDLKAELKKANEADWMTKKAVKVSE